jgi:hypothetical protein
MTGRMKLADVGRSDCSRITAFAAVDAMAIEAAFARDETSNCTASDD